MARRSRPPGGTPTWCGGPGRSDAPPLFAELYRRHSGAVFRYAASRLGREPADDLTSDVFLVAFDRRDRYDTSVPSALPWLLGIATRLIRRHRRD
ncbi:RNA polymerase sigma factor [Leucobacter sp. 7(1)]|uniref:RNA polymerase sigma factor n=1 Tax=Leucobacter sp. 7(1) TaxID=1255613 RepID=UPI000B35EB4E|nr:sigma-70 family RNA polymerase sigma factor [Leucobacter sp. 7(1)]